MFGYKLVSSPVGAYTTAKNSSVEKLRAWIKKNDMDVSMATIFVRGGQVAWATLKPHTTNLASKGLQLEAILFYLFFRCPPYSWVVDSCWKTK